MYFTGTLSIDPAEITEIHKVKPTKAFGKLFYYLSAGLAGTKKEVETFTAVSVLQQLNMAMRAVGIDDVIRLAQDGKDVYLDTKGRRDDLEDAVQAFVDQAPAPGEQGPPFSILQLVLEHDDERFKYLLDLRVRREHKVGEDPICIRVNGVVKQFRAEPGADADAIKQRLAPTFADQAAYDTFVGQHRTHFDAFLGVLEQALGEAIHCDSIHRDTHSNIIRPKGKKKSTKEVDYHQDPDVEPLHGGYPGFDDFFFYTWVWSELSHDHGMELTNVSVVDEHGHSMFDVGSEPVHAGASAAFDPEASFEAPVGGEVSYHGGHAYDGELSDAALLDSSSGGDGTGSGSDGGGWLDSLFSGDGSSWLDSGGSSCASSCGSSCGGCGGCGGD